MPPKKNTIVENILAQRDIAEIRFRPLKQMRALPQHFVPPGSAPWTKATQRRYCLVVAAARSRNLSIQHRVSTPEDTPPAEEPTPAAAPLPRLKVRPSKNQKQRSKLKQHSDEPEPAPPPPPAPAPAAPEPEPPSGPLLRDLRLKRSGHFELRPNQFATSEDAPPEETDY